jgi:hypothetical protein
MRSIDVSLLEPKPMMHAGVVTAPLSGSTVPNEVRAEPDEQLGVMVDALGTSMVTTVLDVAAPAPAAIQLALASARASNTWARRDVTDSLSACGHAFLSLMSQVQDETEGPSNRPDFVGESL